MDLESQFFSSCQTKWSPENMPVASMLLNSYMEAKSVSRRHCDARGLLLDRERAWTHREARGTGRKTGLCSLSLYSGWKDTKNRANIFDHFEQEIHTFGSVRFRTFCFLHGGQTSEWSPESPSSGASPWWLGATSPVHVTRASVHYLINFLQFWFCGWCTS